MSFISRLLNTGRPQGDAGAPQHPSSEQLQQPPQQQRRPRTSAELDNLQIVIRGDSSVGKSCLLARLQGRAFAEEYTPTEKPHAAAVRWSCQGRSASLMVWDAVDTGRPRRARSGLKLTNDSENRSVQRQVSNGEDSPQTDPFADCHGAILMFDMTKAWTLVFVERELARAPKELPVLVLANHRDMGHHRCVTADQARMAIRESGRPTELTRYAESSMRNGYGLKYVHRFLCLPYLCTQRQRLLSRLQANAEDTETAVLELQLEEDESRAMSPDGVENSKNEDVDVKPITCSQEDSMPPPEAPAKTPCRLSAPPARLIPGAEQYLMELRRTQPAHPQLSPSNNKPQRQNSLPSHTSPSQLPPVQTPPSQTPPSQPPPSQPPPSQPPPSQPPPSQPPPSQPPPSQPPLPQPAPPRSEPTGAPSAAVDKAADTDDSDDDNQSTSAMPAVVSTRMDDVDDSSATPGDGEAAATTSMVEDAASGAKSEEVADAPPPTAAPVMAAVDWGPLLARYEDPPAAPQLPQMEQKPRKKKQKQPPPPPQQQQQQPPAEAEEPRRARRKKSSASAAGKKIGGGRIAAETPPQPLPTRPKAVMSKEEEELERFLNE